VNIKLSEYLNSINNFSGSVLIAREGEIILKEGYGYTDKISKIKNTSQTNFGIGSITKSFTAICIMQLIEQKSLSLSDEIGNFFPCFKDMGITVNNLLNHTSGLKNYIYYKELQTGEEVTPSQIIEFISRQSLKFRPGQKWLYSNTNYLLLGQVIEKISTMSYHQFVKEFIIKPIGMKNTFFDGESNENLAKHGKSVFNCHPSLLYASGDIVSNVEDLYLYDSALCGERLISKESIKMMETASYKGRLIKYGYGWFIKEMFNQRSIAHGGFHPIGYTSHFERYLDDKTTVIVLSNEIEKYSRLGIKYFGSTDVARELEARMFNKNIWFWQKFN